MTMLVAQAVPNGRSRDVLDPLLGWAGLGLGTLHVFPISYVYAIIFLFVFALFSFFHLSFCVSFAMIAFSFLFSLFWGERIYTLTLLVGVDSNDESLPSP
jgi:hypothetical protein